MDPERWKRIEQLYHSTLGRPPHERATFLLEACAGDEDLRRQLSVLLSDSGPTGDLVRAGIWEVVAARAGESCNLAPGTRLGPYEILDPIGEGGMGKVYRALDTRLDRAVAIKISAQQFSSRFELEARAIAALNHPNVCTLYDVGPNYLVMELVAGETLAWKTDHSGPLPLQEVLNIGLQVAEAVAAAHSKRIVHRDLKPANVRITPEGRVKVLDFGLAKAMGNEQTEQNTSRLASARVLASATGQVLGTPSYMSPEQAHGNDVGAPTDVWAFGCLMYELLTGKRAFAGETSSEIMAAILTRKPDWQALPPATPAKLRHLLRQCLETDPARRVQDIRTPLAEIEKTLIPRARGLTRGQAAAAGALVIIAGLAAWLLRGVQNSTDRMLQAVPLTSYLGSQDWPTLSPDGSQVAFSWDGERQDNFDIYVKRIGPGPLLRLTHDPAADTAPSWSPDGSSIAFLRASRPGKAAVVLVPPLGGSERVVGEVTRFEPMNAALSWSPDGMWLVVFDRPSEQPSGLWLMSVESGDRRRLTTTPLEWANSGDFSPVFSPDGRFLAFKRLVEHNSFDLFLLPLGTDMRPHGEPRRLTRDSQVVTGLAWSVNGKDLVLSSGSPGNLSLFGMGISGAAAKRLTQQGEILNLAVAPRSHRLVFAQSRREMDIYRAELSAGGGEARGMIPLIASSRLERYPSYPPDGKKIAFASLRSGNWQLWISDSDGENSVQMTSFARGEVAFPVWSPDGSQIGFTSDAEGPGQAYTVDAAGGTPRKLEALSTAVFGFRWSRDGHRIFFVSTRSGAVQLWKVAAAGGAPVQMTHQGVASPVIESADGKLIYYSRPGGIWCVPVAGGPEREVFESDVDPGALEVDPRGIYFLANSSVAKNGDLMFYRFPTGPITKVAGVETRYGFSLSPDGRYLAYTKMTATGSDLMLVENFH